MRLSILALCGLVAMVAAGPEPQTASATVIVETASSTVPLSPLQTCLAACAVEDVNCRAACVGVPYPNDAQANRTTECAATCVQGDGSDADNQRYAECQQACISSYFPTGTGIVAGGAVGVISTTVVVSSTPSGAVSVTSAATSVASSAVSAASSAASAASSVASSASAAAFSAASSASRVASQAASSASAAAVASSTGAAVPIHGQTGASMAGLAGIFIAILAL